MIGQKTQKIAGDVRDIEAIPAEPLQEIREVIPQRDLVGQEIEGVRNMLENIDKSFLDKGASFFDQFGEFGKNPASQAVNKAAIQKKSSAADTVASGAPLKVLRNKPVKKAISSNDTTTLDEGSDTFQDEKTKLLGNEEIFVGDIPVLPDEMLKNTPEVRAILRSVRQEIREKITDYSNQKSKIIRKMRGLSRVAKLSRRQQRKMGQLLNHLRSLDARNSPYKNIEEIGKGSFGEIYRATDVVTGEELVLKVVSTLSKESLDRLVKEAETLISLEDDGVLKGYLLRNTGSKGILNIPKSENKFVIETEYIKGQNLENISTKLLENLRMLNKQSEEKKLNWSSVRSVLHAWDELGMDTSSFYRKWDRKMGGVIPSTDEIFSTENSKGMLETLQEMKNEYIINIIAQACRGMKHAHAKGIIHRDIKPANLMVTPEGKTKIIDWGLVKTLEDQIEFEFEEEERNEVGKTKTEYGSIIGTPLYMAPEQAEGKLLSTSTDIWEMGISLTFSLTGMNPVDAPSIGEVIKKVVNYDLNWSEVEKALGDPLLISVMRKALAQEPHKRFGSMEEFQDALELFNALESSHTFEFYLENKIKEERKKIQVAFSEPTKEEIQRLKDDLLREGRTWDIDKAKSHFLDLIEKSAIN